MLKFIALSGTTSVTHNLYIYETEKSMMILDCGVGFPDLEMQGVDLVIPDFSYVKQNKDKLSGVLLSQGHEDHMGALPFLLREVKADIYCTKLVREFVADKFEEYGIKGAGFHVFNPDEDGGFRIGEFEVNAFRVSHSVPDTVGFAIDTPEGRVFHVAEHKFDPNPVDGQRFDVEKAQRMAEEKPVLMMASDSLGSMRPGTTPSEQGIAENMYNVMRGANQAIFFTTISSNIGRMQQAIDVAERLGRKVAFVGRSIDKKAEIAMELGYMKCDSSTIVDLRDAVKMNRNKILYIIAGCYGQVGSSLYRLAIDEHPRVWAEKGDQVVFSADPAPPYSKETEDFVIDQLIDRGMDVHYYELDEGLYVSGHGSQKDILRLFDIVKPSYYIPVGGTIRFMHGYRKLAEGHGVPSGNIFDLKPGESVIFENGKPRRGNKISVKDVLVHGLGIGDVGKTVLEDRKQLGEEGFVVVVIKVDARRKTLTASPEIISRGFVFEKMKAGMLNASARQLGRKIEKGNMYGGAISKFAVEYLGKFFENEIGRKPMIIPVVVEV